MRRRVIAGSIVVALGIGLLLLLRGPDARLPLLSISFAHYEQRQSETYAVMRITNSGAGSAIFPGAGLSPAILPTMA